MTVVLYMIGSIVGLVALFALVVSGLGIVVIGEDQVGIVVKKFGKKELPAGKIIALDGESGYQADTLAPGWHFFYWPIQYSITHEYVTVVPPGEIALIMAIDGASVSSGRVLAKQVDSDNFQDARKFLTTGGEKGRQIAILSAGNYRINTALFTVITAENAQEHGLQASDLKVFSMPPDEVGIVTTLDGAQIASGDMAGTIVEGHESFQSAQTFIDNGGRKGLQEQILLSGSWNLNPWFVRVERTKMTEIPIGSVGVVISSVGAEHKDTTGEAFKHGDLVDPGHKGIWNKPLYPGKHPLNTKITKIELIPTTNIVLNWANKTESHKYDTRLSSITVRSKDGFSFSLDVSQIIHVAALNAPKVISRVGSMQNLVDHVLEPIIGNYFRNSAQNHTVLDFLSGRAERQKAAAEHIKTALAEYDIEGVDALIGDIAPPKELMDTQTARKIAEEQQATYAVQESAQKRRQLLVRETANADMQKELVASEQGVKIAEMNANVQVKKAEGDARAVTLRAEADSKSAKLRGEGEASATNAVGLAQAAVYKASVDAIGQEGYVAMQVMKEIGENNVRVTPDTLITGGEAGGGGMLMNVLLSKLLKGKLPDVVTKAVDVVTANS